MQNKQHKLIEIRSANKRTRAENSWTATCSCQWQESCRLKTEAMRAFQMHLFLVLAEEGLLLVANGGAPIIPSRSRNSKLDRALEAACEAGFITNEVTQWSVTESGRKRYDEICKLLCQG